MPDASQQRISTYRLILEYDGSRFSGWQDQKNAKTVAGELKAALTSAGFPPLDLGGAGRTDAGVHAAAQVAHLRLGKRTDPESLANALNARLPGAIEVLAIERAEPGFHARHDAVSRTYLYQISRRRTAFAKRFVWWVNEGLDLARMREAGRLFVGRHDFRLFCDADPAEASTLVVVEGVELAEEGELILVRITASHFLWRMVRRMVGALVEVGKGELSTSEVSGLLEGRALAPGRGGPNEWSAPASGLFLERVRYSRAEPLPPLSALVPVPKVRLGSVPAPAQKKTPPRGGAPWQPARHRTGRRT